MDKIIRLCEQGKFQVALELIKQEISHGNISSELYRIKGQGELELGRVEDAINSLIEALKIDDKNENALILIGNIYYKHKDDTETALKYFEKVLSLNTSNYIGLTNIAGVIAQSGNFETAITYFKKALKIKETYSNALYGLALSYNHRGDFLQAFEYITKALLASKKQSNSEERQIYSNASYLIDSISKEYLESIDEDSLYQSFKEKLEKLSGKSIKLTKDNSISTLAKIEIGEYHNKPNHTIKLNVSKAGYAYYVMHELSHLKYVLEARSVHENELFTSNSKTRSLFDKKLATSPRFKKLKKTIGDNILGLSDQLYNGLLLQIYNAPIDLFIDQYLFESYETLRPLQYLAMKKIIGDALKGATDKSIKSNFPAFVRDTNIILSIPMMKQFESLFGVDLTSRIQEKHLINKGSELYLQYLDLKDDKDPAEEYDLIRWWGRI